MALCYPAVMGVLNVTPDSFSDGGRFVSVDAALGHAMAMIEAGADIIDVGGESTRPNAKAVSQSEELDRVIPVIERIRNVSDIPVSVDTSSPEVMRAAADAGASMINDVRALRRPGAVEAAAMTGLPVCLMHMQGEPATMQLAPHYDDLVGDIVTFLRERMQRCIASGISTEKLILDPGIGFGKTPKHNLQIINSLAEFCALGRPVLVGLSRKSTIAKIVGNAAKDITVGSVAGAMMAVAHGASIVRVHDVGPTVAALKVTTAIMRERL